MMLSIKKYIVLLLVASLSFFSILAIYGSEARTGTDIEGNDQIIACQGTAEDEIKISSRFLELIFGKDDEKEKLILIPGGGIFGAKIKQSYVTIQNPGEYKDLKPGDKILSINGMTVSSVKDIKNAIKAICEDEISITLERGNKNIQTKIKPRQENGEYKLGVTLKDGAAGIGTVTYINPKTGEFGGLGHGICDTDTGDVINLCDGKVTGVILSGVKKGEEGKPGELSGLLTEKVCGELYSNTECGVFGKLYDIPDSATACAVEIAHRDEVHTGEATILSTVKLGSTKQYKIEITDVNKSSTGTKSFKIKVTDPTLIAITGGVVRGMSGSPIIQDGKLVGAVTHVMVANPTEGYGIFIENMLSAASDGAQPKAA